MPKERRDRSVSFERSRASPFPCSSSHSKHSLPKNPLEKEENMKEWEDARCPVCMEHPHNAILLMCSSHEKGCRPFMCDTSYRHSNCFDQFHKSFTELPSAPEPLQEPAPPSNQESQFPDLRPERLDDVASTSLLPCENQENPKLVCPLCRGQVNGWVVVEAARRFMNSKSRSCASETCEYSGTYVDLRKHARLVHPLVRPSEADPERQRSWRRLERQRDLGDLISTLQSSIGEERNEDINSSNSSTLAIDEGGWLTVFFLIRVFRPGSGSRSSSWSGSSRARAQVTVRRRPRVTSAAAAGLWGESYDGDEREDDNNESSDGGSVPLRRSERIRRQPTPDNQS